MSTGFDLSTWKEQAAGELTRLEEKETQLAEDLKRVQAEKAQIAEVLGLKTSPRRRRYKTAIKEFFESKGTSVEMAAEAVIAALFDGDSASIQGVKVSMARLAKDNRLYSYDGATGILTYTPPPPKVSKAKK
jgi:predicted nuclease with TOPRIM domain